MQAEWSPVKWFFLQNAKGFTYSMHPKVPVPQRLESRHAVIF